MKAVSIAYNQINEYRSYITYTLFATSALLISLYVFSIYNMISHSVALQHIEIESMKLATAVQKLDTQYIELSNKVTPDLVRSYGMSEGKVSNYISRTSSLGVVSLSGYEL